MMQNILECTSIPSTTKNCIASNVDPAAGYKILYICISFYSHFFFSIKDFLQYFFWQSWGGNEFFKFMYVWKVYVSPRLFEVCLIVQTLDWFLLIYFAPLIFPLLSALPRCSSTVLWLILFDKESSVAYPCFSVHWSWVTASCWLFLFLIHSISSGFHFGLLLFLFLQFHCLI
jgi:hypothetical protein